MLINNAINCEIIKHSRGYRAFTAENQIKKKSVQNLCKINTTNAFHFIDTDTFQSERSFKVVIREWLVPKLAMAVKNTMHFNLFLFKVLTYLFVFWAKYAI